MLLVVLYAVFLSMPSTLTALLLVVPVLYLLVDLAVEELLFILERVPLVLYLDVFLLLLKDAVLDLPLKEFAAIAFLL